MQVSINANHLKAAACFMADQDVRYYLIGVFVEVRPTETRLVGLNGACCGVLRDVVKPGAQPNMPDVIIPSAIVKLALQTKSQVLSLDYTDDKWAISGINFTPVEGTFPPYRRIIPETYSDKAAHFDQALLARFGKAAKALGAKSNPVIRQNGEGGAQVQILNFEDEFVGVIMPMRMFTEKRPDPGLVRWGSEQVPETAECDLA